MDALDAIRAEVNARFTSDAFYVRLADAMYERALKHEMKHLWDHRFGDFKGADEYRLYVREKIKLAQRLRWWEDEYHFRRHSPGCTMSEAEEMLMNIDAAQRRLVQKRLDIREKIGEVSYV